MSEGFGGGRLLLLLALTAGAYLGVLHAGFVWDDEGLILLNRRLAEAGSPVSLLGADLWEGTPAGAAVSGYHRPLMLLSLWADRRLFGLEPAGYHLHSLLWHLGAVAALWTLLRPLLPPAGLLLACAVFALHPLQVEAVAWVAARNDPMALALGLGALAAVSDPRPSAPRLGLGLALAALALMAKESVILLPLLYLVLCGGSGRRPAGSALLALVGGLGLALLLRAIAGVSGAAWPDPSGWALLGRRLPALLGTWGADLVLGWPRVASRSLEWLDQEPGERVALGLFVWAAFLLLALRARGLVAAGLLWLVLGLLPVLVPIADKGGLGDRFLYLPMVGFALALGAGLRRPVHALPLLPLAVVLVVLRVQDWAADRSLWERDHAVLGTPYTGAGLAMVRLRDGRIEEGMRLLVAALDDDPPAREGCEELVHHATRTLPPERSEPLGRFALRRGCPRTGRLATDLALVQAELRQWDRVGRTLGGAPRDPLGRDRLLRAALARRVGDEAAVVELLAEDPDPVGLEARVDAVVALLTADGVHIGAGD